MQAIILAAGMGKRLGEYTRNNTKCMVPVNGVPLQRMKKHKVPKEPRISELRQIALKLLQL